MAAVSLGGAPASGRLHLVQNCTRDARAYRLKPMPLNFPREVLLIEIERYCLFRDCAARNHIGLTKAEAIEYRGFDCRKCQRWNDDTIGIDAVPDSWADAIPLNDSETAN